MSTENSIAVNPKYKEFGVKDNSNVVSFNNLHEKTQNIIKEPLSKLFYFNLFCNDVLREKLGENWLKVIMVRIQDLCC